MVYSNSPGKSHKLPGRVVFIYTYFSLDYYFLKHDFVGS